MAGFVIVQILALSALGVRLGTSSDEEYTLRTTAHGVVAAVRLAYSYELQAPVYFALCAFWRSIDGDPLFARALSIAAVGGLSFVVARISRRVAPQRSALTAVVLVAINPFVIYSAEDIRPYALGLLLSAVLALAFLDGYWFATASSRARLTFVLAGICTVFTEYYFAFALVGFAVALIVAPRPRREVVRYLGDATLVAIALLPTLPLIGRELAAYGFSPTVAHASAAEVFEEPWRAFVIASDGLRHLGMPHVVYAMLCFAFIGAFVLGRVHIRFAALRAFAGALFTIDLLYVATTVIGHVDLAPPRHFIAAIIPLMVALVVAIQQCRPASWRSRAGVAAAVGIYAFAAAATTVFQFRSLSSQGDWSAVVAYLRVNAHQADRIVLYPPESLPAFVRAGGGPLAAATFPSRFDPHHYDVASFLQDATRARTAISTLRRSRVRTWFVVACEYRPLYFHEGCPQIEGALETSFPAHGVTRFFGSWIAELRPPEAAAPVGLRRNRDITRTGAVRGRV